MCFRLVVLLLIRRGLNRLNNQLRKIIKLLPVCEEWDRDSMDTTMERGKVGRGKDYMKRENGECRDNMYVASEVT